MTLDELRSAVQLLPAGSSITLPRDALLEALAPGEMTPPAIVDDSEQWLTAEECAARLNVSARWCYDHAAQLGVRRLSRRCVRFSSRAVARHMARRT